MSLSIYTVQTLMLDNVSWTDVIPPFPCNSLIVRNLDDTNAVRIQPEPSLLEEDSLTPGAQQTLRASHAQKVAYRFLVGVVALRLRAVAGTPQARVTYLV